MIDSILDKKKRLRSKQLKLRKTLSNSVKSYFNRELFEKLFNEINYEKYYIISSFISINSEINTVELNNFILKKNKLLCLPVVFKKNNHLIFKEFTNKKNMVDGFKKIKEPAEQNKTLIPDLLFVPCLAFDTLGFRLGYGGGYYDRTFSFLKKNKYKFLSIGYAFDAQKVSNVPKDQFDIRLDYVITEKQIYKF